MKVRVEQTAQGQEEEVVVYCRAITPEIDAVIRQLRRTEAVKAMPAFHKGDQQYYLSLREVLFFETDDERVFAHTADSAYEVNQRLYELDAALPGYFVRVSRSAIVNILHVFSIQKSLTRVCHISFRQSHKEVYGSRMYSQDLYQKMNERYHYENQ